MRCNYVRLSIRFLKRTRYATNVNIYIYIYIEKERERERVGYIEV